MDPFWLYLYCVSIGAATACWVFMDWLYDSRPLPKFSQVLADLRAARSLIRVARIADQAGRAMVDEIRRYGGMR